MNFNFHFITCSVDESRVRLDIEQAAYEALVDDSWSLDALLALASLVDWEQAELRYLSGLGMRCERALEQRLRRVESGNVLAELATASPTIERLQGLRWGPSTQQQSA